MKIFKAYIKHKRERSLRERCVKYASQIMQGQTYNGIAAYNMADILYEYITTGETRCGN